MGPAMKGCLHSQCVCLNTDTSLRTVDFLWHLQSTIRFERSQFFAFIPLSLSPAW